jgi:hypothetical protein
MNENVENYAKITFSSLESHPESRPLYTTYLFGLFSWRTHGNNLILFEARMGRRSSCIHPLQLEWVTGKS